MSDKNETDLGKYKRDGKTLIPPMAQIGMTTVSWINDRLPDILWAALAISQLERADALDFFRYSIGYVQGKSHLSDVTLSGIANLSIDDRIGFIMHITSYGKVDVKRLLRPMLLLKHLPALEEWRYAIEQEPVVEEDWADLAKAMQKCLWHQSQEATDCRWVKVLAMILSGKLSRPEEMALEIIHYPNRGDQRGVRPSIRSTEIMRDPDSAEPTWPSMFWDEAYENTQCVPELTVKDGIEEKFQDLQKELENSRPHYFKQSKSGRHALIDKYFDVVTSTAVDAKIETVFGLSLYGLGLFIENNMYRSALSVHGRILLRSIFETYVTLAYLLKKEEEGDPVWSAYRSYGSGQANLIYRKYEEADLQTEVVDRQKIETIANEDKWVEFVPIELGHWDATDLRSMCEYVGEKELYDKYYSYGSAFAHSSWLAVRETEFQRCFNPLHRLHRVPTYDLPLMTSVTTDMREIANKILSIVDKIYKPFSFQLTPPGMKDKQDEQSVSEPERIEKNNTEQEVESDAILQRASAGILLCIENAEQYQTAAKSLFEGGMFREAYLLSMYAGEELGRVLLVFNYPLYKKNPEKYGTWKKRYSDHTEKFWFFKDLDTLAAGVIPDGGTRSVAKGLKNKRLEVSYVEYRNEHFEAPDVVTKEDAKEILEEVSRHVARMKERHPDEATIRKELVQLEGLPKDVDAIRELLRKSGFKDKDRPPEK